MILDTLTLADEARKDPPREAIICQPKCTSDFCSKNPRAICSAEDNADQSKSCQETCQHTSCSACRFLQSVPRPCPHCAKDDFKCIKQFGRCIRKQNCRRRKFPCVSKGLAAKEDFGKFQCSVPDCPVE
ncbi:hypothetical protein BV898_13560 [Hypsibius exemplaris]|uniref:Uncharacterized protein n=1 Tax=Hypsibius exemplaris TaxID=2072580 RepID=A0A1W0WAG3_HYPEX|nr:hypothetical protein BV898_13560 [Hypsibius exemplaris]